MATPTAPKRRKRNKSVLKRIRQTRRHTVRNRRHKVTLRRQVKQFRRALASGNRAEVEKLLRPTISLIDRAIQQGIIHPNRADRYKSRLMLHYNALPSPGAAG